MQPHHPHYNYNMSMRAGQMSKKVVTFRSPSTPTTLENHSKLTLTGLIANLVRDCTVRNVGVDHIRNYLLPLPVELKQKILLEMQTPEFVSLLYPKVKDQDQYQELAVLTVRNIWHSLYHGAFAKIVIPNLEKYTQRGSRSKSSSRSIVKSQQGKSEKWPNGKMKMRTPKIQETYVFMLESIRNQDFLSTKEIHFQCYSNSYASCIEEKAIMFDLLRGFMNIKVLDLG